MGLALGPSDGVNLLLSVNSQIAKPTSKTSALDLCPSQLFQLVNCKASPRSSLLLQCRWRDGSCSSPPGAVANSVLSATEDSGIEDEMLRALKERRTEDSWQFYQVLRRGGILPSRVCCSRLVAQLSHKGAPSSLSRAQRVVVDLQKLDKADRLDADSLGLLAVASARAGAGRYALSILRLMLSLDLCPPVKVWSAVVSRLGKHVYDAPLALELFDEICDCVAPDDSNSNGDLGMDSSGIPCVATTLEGGKAIQVQKGRVGGNDAARPDTAAFNAVLNACATLGFVNEADRLLERMANLGVEPNVLSFNILIKLFAKAEESDQLVSIVEQMQELGVEPELSTYNSLVASYVSLGEIDEAERVVRSMQLGSSPSSAGANLIDQPVQAEEDRGTTKVLRGLERLVSKGERPEKLKDSETQPKVEWKCKVKPNVRTYTTLMKGYVNCRRVKEAVQLLIAMQNLEDSSCKPNEVTYTTVIAACVNVGLVDEAKGLLLEMVAQKVPANIMSYNILLKGYCNVGLPSLAYEVMQDMKRAGLSPDVVSYNTLIHACIQRDDNVGALEVFREMRRSGIAPSEISYTTLMNAFARNGQPKLVAEVFQELRNDPWMRVDVIAWNVLIDGYCRAGWMSEAKESFMNMKDEGFLPTVSTYGSLVKGFSAARKPGEVLVIWNEIQERTLARRRDGIEPLEPDGGLLDCLVDPLLRAGFFQKALEVVACMEGRGILADKTKYKRMFIELYSTLYTSKHASARRVAKSADKRTALDSFKFWLGLPNNYYESDWRP